jgi:hypothetical protein
VNTLDEFLDEHLGSSFGPLRFSILCMGLVANYLFYTHIIKDFVFQRRLLGLMQLPQLFFCEHVRAENPRSFVSACVAFSNFCWCYGAINRMGKFLFSGSPSTEPVIILLVSIVGSFLFSSLL